jgi:hypothetical protein
MAAAPNAGFSALSRSVQTPEAATASFASIASLFVTFMEVRVPPLLLPDDVPHRFAFGVTGVVTALCSSTFSSTPTPCSLLVLRDGPSLLIGDYGGCIWLIDPTTRARRIVAGSGARKDTDGDALRAGMSEPMSMAFDTRSVVPESAVFIATERCLRRLNLELCMFLSHVACLCKAY